jgi:hypothetical protein
MKKLFIIIALTVLSVGSYAVERNDGNDDIKKVSYTAIRQFEDEFKTAQNVSWKVNDQYVRASFTAEGKKMSALYDLQGSFLGAVEYVSYDQIPVKAKIELEKRYKDYSFSSALKIVSRPSYSDFNDVGTYWVDMINDAKQLYLSVSPSSVVALHKTVSLDEASSN